MSRAPHIATKSFQSLARHTLQPPHFFLGVRKHTQTVLESSLRARSGEWRRGLADKEISPISRSVNTSTVDYAKETKAKETKATEPRAAETKDAG